jgi:hypothetical protein
VTASTVTLWETIAEEAALESTLWAAALRSPRERERVPVFSPLGERRFALGLETIYEGYLLHYGQPRLFAPADRDTSVLLGDYLYAHGLVRIAQLGNVAVVADLAALISLCAQLRADGDVDDGPLWAATVALLGTGDERLSDARAARPDENDNRPQKRRRLVDAAAAVVGREAVGRALALHEERVH